MKVIIISGSVGTGKTTLSKQISDKQGYPILNITHFIKQKHLSQGYDKKRKCEIIDIKRLNKEILKEIKKVKKQNNPKAIIIDSHLSHHLPKKYIDLCIITKCDIKILEKRLKKRKYSKAKIRENIDVEILDLCLIEAKQAGHRIVVIDTTKGTNITEITKLINTLKKI